MVLIGARGGFPGSLAAGIALVISSAACGEGLVPATSYDQPLFSFGGSIRPQGGIAIARDRTDDAPARNPRVSLLWTDPLQSQPDVPAPPRTVGSTIDVEKDSFTLDVFRPPPAGALVDVIAPSGEVSTLALAEIVIVDDADGDGTFRVAAAEAAIAAPDLYLAGSVVVLAYVARPFPTPQIDFPLVPAGTVGFQLLSYQCEGEITHGIDMVSQGSVDLVLQPSLTFPELRSCRRTHSP
jgi:hypothetical protein